MNNTDQALEWALKLYQKSPLKQKKFAMLSKIIGNDLKGECLDIGSDNGTISYLLRQKGGNWHSADLTLETVSAIKSLGLNNVVKIDGLKTNFANEQFDLVVIVDFLEHIETDREFAEELKRILKPGAKLIVNVPRPINGVLRRVQKLIGQTDQAHGHVRSGYSIQGIKDLFDTDFEVQKYEYYSRCFSVFIDTLITFALDILKGKRGQKGTVVTDADQQKLEKSFRLYSLIYPVITLFITLDNLFSFLPGNMLIVELKKL